MTSSQAKR